MQVRVCDECIGRAEARMREAKIARQIAAAGGTVPTNPNNPNPSPSNPTAATPQQTVATDAIETPHQFPKDF